MKTFKLISLDKSGRYKDIWRHMPHDVLPDFIKIELAKESVGTVVLENEKERIDEC
tara:strand:- start:4128 stop:4295 length:168 start_codon:yes stop_codon:yes gene_type:complete